MGREIRMVPPNYEAPRYTEDDAPNSRCIGEYKNLYDRSYLEALSEWIKGHLAWESGEDPDRKEYPQYRYFAQWHGNAPSVEHYRPDFTEPATWFQVYETVSEGSPVTPPFATQDELIDYLVANGDFWDQKRRKEKADKPHNFHMECDPWPRDAATRFVKGSGFAPSLVVSDGVCTPGHLAGL